MKRIALFAAMNIAVLVVITATVELLGLDRYLAARRLSLTGLLGLSAILGFGGALISLALSKWMAKIAVGVRVILDQSAAHRHERAIASGTGRKRVHGQAPERAAPLWLAQTVIDV